MVTQREMVWRYGILFFGVPTGLIGGVLWWIQRSGWPPTNSVRFAVVMVVWLVFGALWGAAFGWILSRFLSQSV
jgi:ABC-type xylose transport system permease subunit